MNNELIKRLKDKNYVRAFGLMTPEEKGCFEKVGWDNCIYFANTGSWVTTILARSRTFSQSDTYAIKPDYKPAPEYWDCEIERIGRLLMARPQYGMGDILTGPTSIHKLPSLPNFHEFWLWDDYEDDKRDKEEPIYLEDVSRLIDKKRKVFARFRK